MLKSTAELPGLELLRSRLGILVGLRLEHDFGLMLVHT